MTRPAYQSIVAADSPTVALANGSGVARIIAGELDGAKGPARTFTPINVWDARLAQGKEESFALPEEHSAMVVVISGRLTINGSAELGEADMVILCRDGVDVTVPSDSAATFLTKGNAS